MRLVGGKYGFSTFLDFLYLVWLSRYKGMINGEKLVAIEHMMFMFDDLKVTSRDDDRMQSTKVQTFTYTIPCKVLHELVVIKIKFADYN